MLLCRTGPLPRKPGRTKGWNLLPDCVRSCLASTKFPMPWPRSRPPLFYPFSPEAVLPTGEKKEGISSADACCVWVTLSPGYLLTRLRYTGRPSLRSREGEKKIEAKPAFRAAKRGWSGEAKTG
jgi:hypothetical protein